MQTLLSLDGCEEQVFSLSSLQGQAQQLNDRALHVAAAGQHGE